jgi:hypothetical protein
VEEMTKVQETCVHTIGAEVLRGSEINCCDTMIFADSHLRRSQLW